MEGVEVYAEGNVAIAAKRREGFGLKHHRYQSDVRVVHGLQRDARVIAVEVAVLNEILDGLDNLFLSTRGLRAGDLGVTDFFKQVGLLEPRFKHCEGPVSFLML